MNNDLRLNVSQCAIARSHLYGAESMNHQTESEALFKANADPKLVGHSVSLELAARRRYWREQAAARLLDGYRWPEAEKLGGVA